MDVAYKNYGRVMKSYENHFVFVCVVSPFCFVCLDFPRRESWKRNQFLGDLDVCRSLHPTRMGCFLTSYCLGGNREAKLNGCLLDVLMDVSWIFLIFPNMNSMQTEFQFNGTARLSSEPCRSKVGAASDDLTVEGSSYIRKGNIAHLDGLQPC